MSQDNEDEDDDFEYEDPKCPFCLRSDDCPHVLLHVDLTFRTAGGGVLMEAFNERWSQLCEKGGDNFIEHEPFLNLLDEVDSLADASAEYDQDGVPGMSSSYAIYYVKSMDDTLGYLAKFLG